MSLVRTSLAVLAASQLAWHTAVLAQATPDGTEFQVNSYTTNHQSAPAVSRTANGFVVVWQSIGSGGTDTSVESIQAQLYDSNGMAVGAQFQVNTYTFSNQRRPSVAVDSGGSFVIVWDSFGTLGTDGGLTSSIQAQRYDSNGVALGTQFQVNTYTTGNQESPAVSAGVAGNFVVVWHSYGSAGTDTNLTSIQGQRYNSAGVAQGGEFQVNTFTPSHQRDPAVATDGSGNFVVVWHSSGSAGTDTSYSSIQARRYDSAGVAQGGQFQVNTYTTSFQYFPSVVTDDPGNFVVAWASHGSAGTDTSAYSVQARRYDSTGVPQGSQFQVNTYTQYDQLFPAVGADGLGFVVVWQSVGSAGTDSSAISVQGQKYDLAGLAEGAEFQVNTYTPNNQIRPAVTEMAGSVSVVWESTGSAGTDTDLGSIQGQLYSIPVITTTSSSSTSSTTLPPRDLLPGRITVIKPSTLAKFVAKPVTGDTFALPTVDPVAVGGTLRVFDVATTAGDDTYPLPTGGTPPLGWKGLGIPAGAKGYKYKGAGTPGDPCKIVLVKETVIKGVCRGAGMALTPPFTGDVGVILTLGGTDRYCARFGGDVVKNDPTLTKRKNAPAPGACP
jgi:hypothetical protein